MNCPAGMKNKTMTPSTNMMNTTPTSTDMLRNNPNGSDWLAKFNRVVPNGTNNTGRTKSRSKTKNNVGRTKPCC